MSRPLVLPALLVLAALMPGQTSPNPEELGAVAWLRDLDAGLARAKEVGRPVFLQFQEVPG